MSQSDKSAYYQALKAAGVQFDRHFREYNTKELAEAYTRLKAAGQIPEQPVVAPPPVAPPPPPLMLSPLENAARQQAATPVQAPPAFQRPAAPLAPRDPREMAGQRQNSQPEDQPIRTDELGRVWYQEEVLKPAFPKPRGRRVLDYIETGTKVQQAQNGQYTESFEIAGDEQARQAQVKITLPSYQVGKYRDPRFPFMVITYNGNEVFDLFDVQKFYGGAELVPTEVKRKYVENVLCFDIRTTIRAIQTEFRQQQLAGKVQA
jgi:hypothetical protein